MATTFTLEVVGSVVIYSPESGPDYMFMSLPKAHRYIRRWNAVKVAGQARRLSGTYSIKL